LDLAVFLGHRIKVILGTIVRGISARAAAGIPATPGYQTQQFAEVLAYLVEKRLGRMAR